MTAAARCASAFEFTKARREGRREERDAYAFDAFVRVFQEHDQQPDDGTNERRHRCPSYLSILRLDYEALLRGYLAGDELCEIAGLGPVPVTTARTLLGDSILKLVLTRVRTSPTSPTSGAARRSRRRSPCCGNHRVAASTAAPARGSSATTANLGRTRSTPGSTSSTRSARSTTSSSTATAGPSSTAPANAPWCRPTTGTTPRTGPRPTPDDRDPGVHGPSPGGRVRRAQSVPAQDAARVLRAARARRRRTSHRRPRVRHRAHHARLAAAGHGVIGVDPNRLMLDVARRGRHGDHVRWIEGGAHDIGVTGADLAIMTGHVAQFFVRDDEWSSALAALRAALRTGGRLAFETRNPGARAWA